MNSFGGYALIAATCVAAAGCGRLPDKDHIPLVYKVEVQQGNVITQEMLAQLKPGMDKAKVRFIMGTPLVQDVFHQNRWDYVYTFQERGSRRVQRRVSLYFENDVLARVEGDVVRATGPIKVEQRRDVTVAVPADGGSTLVSRVKHGLKLGAEDEPVEETGEQPAGDQTSSDAQAAGKTSSEDSEVSTAPDDQAPSLFDETMGSFGKGTEASPLPDEDDERLPQDPTDPDYDPRF